VTRCVTQWRALVDTEMNLLLENPIIYSTTEKRILVSINALT
jgi:hypothetical protein